MQRCTQLPEIATVRRACDDEPAGLLDGGDRQCGERDFSADQTEQQRHENVAPQEAHCPSCLEDVLIWLVVLQTIGMSGTLRTIVCPDGSSSCTGFQCAKQLQQSVPANKGVSGSVHLLGQAAGPLATPELLYSEAQNQGCQCPTALKAELGEEVLHGQCCMAQSGSSESATATASGFVVEISCKPLGDLRSLWWAATRHVSFHRCVRGKSATVIAKLCVQECTLPFSFKTHLQGPAR